ncbi:MAG: hypothetical protein JKY54_03565 [Flavobacteriales bacterium]|nr:hypothetical protein [Flavobacteriales bacterium]
MIKIPNPCSEDWAAMSPKQKGRFCASCKVHLSDLDQYSPSEISKMDHGGNCKSIDQEYFSYLEVKSQLMRFAAALFFVFGSSLFSTSGAWALPGYDYEQVLSDEESREVIIKGRLVNKRGKPHVNTVVHVTSNGDSLKDIYTNENGYFSVHLTLGDTDDIELRFFNMVMLLWFEDDSRVIDKGEIVVTKRMKQKTPTRRMGSAF